MIEAADPWQLLMFPEAASSISSRVDHLFWAMVVTCGLVVLLVFVLLLVFSIRYRRGSRADRTPSARLNSNHWLEIGWSVPVLVGFLVFFAWGAVLYLDLYDPPAPADGNVREINVIAKQWMWKFQHPEGMREINDLHLAVGQTVRLRMTSQDVIHSFFVPAFRIKQDVLPRTYTELQFTPTKVGRFHLFCAEYCGLQHSGMTGEVVVMSPPALQGWLDRQGQTRTPEQDGARLFRSYGCSGCHDPDSSVHAPDLAGLYGKPVPLADGTTVRADAQYIRDSILLPSKQVAAGYPAIMPSFQGQISEADVLKLTAYIQSLTEQETDPP